MPNEAAHCHCLDKWVAMKKRWGLSVDETERAALLRHAVKCPAVTLSYACPLTLASRAPSGARFRAWTG